MAGYPYRRFYNTWANSFGEDRILEMIEDGRTIAAIQRKVWAHMVEQGGEKDNPRPPSPDSEKTPTFSRQLFYHWLDSGPKHEVTGKTEKRARWKKATQRSADSLVDDAQDLLDHATVADVGLKREQAKQRQWLAGKRNPDRYGDQKQAIQINVGDLHLSALRQRSLEQLEVKQEKALPAPDEDDADYEVVFPPKGEDDAEES